MGRFLSPTDFTDIRRFLFAYSLALIFVLLLFLFDSEQVLQSVEVFLHDKTEALSVQTVLGEVTVVGLVVHSHGEITIRKDEVTQVEVTDKALGGIGIVPVAELSVEEQTVVEQATAQNTLIFRIAETLVSRRDVGTEIPFVAFHQTGETERRSLNLAYWKK